jgi:hypothetical protein
MDQEIQIRHHTLTDQEKRIAANNAILWQNDYEYRKIDDLRKATITQIGRIAGMSEREIADLQLNAQVHLMQTLVENRVKEFTRAAAAEALNRFMAT